MEHLDSKSGVILFSDLKDFTYKTSLLTQKQIDKILNDQDKLMLLNLKKYKGELIKTIGDSYMIFFELPKNAVLFAIEIQKLLQNYNKDKKIPLSKIEIRISIDYGTLNRKNTLNGHDFFGDSVNLASRVLSRTLENKIFITNKVYDDIIEEGIQCRYNYIGKTNFKGILYEVDLYEVLYKEEEMRLFDKGKFDYKYSEKILESEKTLQRNKNIDDIIFKGSAINTVLSTQPIPFIDISSSVGMYLYMLYSIAGEYGVKLSKRQATEILITIFGAIGSNFAINQTLLGVSKIGLIGIAGFLLIPLNFGVTYGVGKTIAYYFYSTQNNLKIDNADIKTLFLTGKEFGQKYSKKNKKEILSMGHKSKQDFLNFKTGSQGEMEKISQEIQNSIHFKK